MNKSNEKEETKNSVYTPKTVQEALENLPHNYVVKTQEIFSEKRDRGVEISFSDRYIKKVKLGEAFNQEVMEALVKVGEENLSILRRFGFTKKKTTPTK